MKLRDLVKTKNNFDSILHYLLKLIHKGQKNNSDYYGKVAACIIDNDSNKVFGINHVDADGNRVHAERAVVRKYIKKHGKIPKNSIMIATLSPCSNQMADRHGKSCTDFLNHIGISKVYYGYEDPTQADTCNNKRKFNVELTNNIRIQKMCKQIADTFL